MIEERTVECPYCGEAFATLVDWSAGDQAYVEDCTVCCRPIEFRLSADGAGSGTIDTLRDDE